MTTKRLYYILIGLVGLTFIGLILGVQQADKILSKHAAVLTQLKAKDQANQYEQKRLVKAQQAIRQYADLEKVAKVVVPQDKNQAEAVRELVNIANNDGIQIASITFPLSTLGAVSTGNGSSSTASGSSTAIGTAPTPPKPQSADSPANKLSQLLAVPGMPGVYQLSINLTTDANKPATFNQVVRFLSDLEHNRRTAQVNTINLSPSPSNPNLISLSISLNEYIKP